MRTGWIAGILIVIALAIFNPGMDAFKAFAAERAEALILEETGDSVLGRALSGAGASLTGEYVDRITQRRNYLLFSTYTVDPDNRASDDENWIFLGIAGQFVEVERPST